eukprot:15421149-Alexandrium_andersonii.AAC.1
MDSRRCEARPRRGVRRGPHRSRRTTSRRPAGLRSGRSDRRPRPFPESNTSARRGRSTPRTQAQNLTQG